MKPFGLLMVAGSLACAAPVHAQQPEISLHVVEMSPASPSVLHKGDRLYLRIRYETNIEMLIRPEYRDRGARAPRTRTNAAWLLDPGQGETLAWVTFAGTSAIDTIHLSASGSGRDGFASQDLTVDYKWDEQPSAAEPPPDWVGPLLAAENARQTKEFADLEKRFGSGAGAGAAGAGAVTAIGLGVVAVAGAAMLAAFAWPIWGLIRWRGPWRIAAAAPIAALALWVVKDVVDLVRDPTSHNLLPFEFVIGAFCFLPYMVVVAIWRRIALRGSHG
jgi:hypothetical protein